MSLSNKLQNAISAVSVIQTLISKTTQQFEFGPLHKGFKSFETSDVRTPNLDILLSALRTIKPTTIFSVAGNFKTKIRNRMKFRVLNVLVF
jgi:hypothetical protein